MAQTPQTIQVDDLYHIRSLSDILLSPDGSLAAFLLHQPDAPIDGYRSDLWIYSTRTRDVRQLTTSGRVGLFDWQADSRRILFTDRREQNDSAPKAAREERTVFYQIDVNGGEAVRRFEVKKKIREFRIVNEDTLLFTAPDRETAPVGADAGDCEILEEIPFWRNGVGFTSGVRNRLFLLDIASGEPTSVTDSITDVGRLALNAGHTAAVFPGLAFRDKMEVPNALYQYDLTARRLSRLTPPGREIYANAGYLADGQIAFTASHVPGFGAGDNPRIGHIPADGSAPRLDAPHDICIGRAIGSDVAHGTARIGKTDGDSFYFVTTEDAGCFLNRLTAGRAEKLLTVPGAIDGFDAQSGRILFAGLLGQQLSELYEIVDGAAVRRTHFNDEFLGARHLSAPRPLTVETAPGVTVEGWVIPPADYQAGKRYPAILNMHGGPRAAYGPFLSHEFQFLAAQGYFVFFCNPRGSEGKGDRFADIRGKHGTIDFDDLMRFTDTVLDAWPAIDPKRVGVTGGSYAGYMTNWIIGHTDRFHAAVSQRSISNMISKFCTTDNGYYYNRDQYGATPWEDAEKLWKGSPLRTADRVRTPTLFLHSDEDYRCCLSEGLQMFTALKFFGVPARLCLFHGENHGLSRNGKPSHRIRRLQEMAGWFDRYLKPADRH